jgi:hypothetical protein
MRSLLLFPAASLLAFGSAAIGQGAPAGKPVSKADYMKIIDARFAAIDTNHDGVVSKAELAAAEQKLVQQLTAARNQKMREEFNKLDTNKDGKLTFDEFMAAAPPVRAAQTPDQIIQALDKNHDGKISADEFRAPEIVKFDKADANHDGIVTPDEARAAAGRQ